MTRWFGLFCLAVLGGCLSKPKDPGHEPFSSFNGAFHRDIVVEGLAGSAATSGADVSATTPDGQSIVDGKSGAAGHYSLAFRWADDTYALELTANGGIDLVTGRPPEFVLRGVVASGKARVVANINAFSTLAVEIARGLNGGLRPSNLRDAEEIAATALNCGLTTLVADGPMTATIDGRNAAELGMASATLAEIFRRTSAQLVLAGFDVSANEVIRALGADLVDGLIEGNGGRGADPLVAAVASVVTAQVLAESLSHRLRVDGLDAMGAIEATIAGIVGNEPTVPLGELKPGLETVAQFRRSLAVVAAVSDDPAVLGLAGIARSITPETSATELRAILPPGFGRAVSKLTMRVAMNDSDLVEAINLSARRAHDGAPNRPPTISGEPPSSAPVGSTYVFRPAFSDLDGDALTFGISGRPAWLVFDSQSGQLFGTPSAHDVGVYRKITVTVSDGIGIATLGPFSISVVNAGSMPSIAGTPPTTVVTGNTYYFSPRADDPDGDELQFRIDNKPAWVSFDAGSGILAGVPREHDVGSYHDIRVSVSDGDSTAALAAFTITVTSILREAGAVTVSWTPPTHNSDGTILEDLAGFRVYWRAGSAPYRTSMLVTNAAATRAVVDDLEPGRYEFAVTALNSHGRESGLSEPVEKVAR